MSMAETGQATGQVAGQVTWLTINEVMAKTGLGERSIRRMIAKGLVTSRIEDGRRLVMADSLQNHGNRQGQRHGVGTGSNHDSGPDTDHGDDHDSSHDKAMIVFLQQQLHASREAERELRLLLGQATRAVQLLAEPKALPPPIEAERVVSPPEPVPPRQVRWWQPWRR